jgi:hypothetical protein
MNTILKALISPAYRTANVVLARRPDWLIIGTGRCGTRFTASLLRANGIQCGHEAYFTPDGPKLRNPYRRFTVRGDSSWLAVPYLPDERFRVVHQVRHPYKVIKSFYNIGFFDPSHDARRLNFIAFAKRHFEWSDDPLRSSLRWYLEWNAKCEAITDQRYQVEKMTEMLPQIGSWLDLDIRPKELAKDRYNSRTPKVANPLDDVSDAIRKFPEYDQLLAMCDRYGYEL